MEIKKVPNTSILFPLLQLDFLANNKKIRYISRGYFKDFWVLEI
jgi:hypothetical protein